MYSLSKSLLKRLSVCLYLFILSAGIQVVAQNNDTKPVLDKIISIQLNDVRLADALHAIADNAGCTISYNNSKIDAEKRVSINYSDISVSEALSRLLGNSLKKAQVSGKQIFLQMHSDAKGGLRGSIKTSDGKPAEFVNVVIKGTGKGAQTNENGSFAIQEIPAGNQIIIVRLLGYQPIETEVEIVAGQTVTANVIRLNEDSRQLQEVTVNSSKTNRFADKESDYVARLPLKNLENPQVYNVVTNAIMKEQMITTYAEAFQNVAGISTSNILNTRGTSFFMRGFSSPPSLRNGMTAPISAESIEPVNIERVEVLKGPSATLFGSSRTSFGGAVNNITKKPFARKAGEISYSMGSWDLSRLTVDYNTPVNKDSTLLLRVNAARHWTNTFQDFGYQHNYAFTSSVLYKATDRLTLQLDAEMNSYKGTMWSWAYFGPDVTVKNVKDLKIPYNRSIAGNQLLQEWTSSSIYAKAEYKISDKWTSSTNFIQSIYNRSELYGMNNNQWLNDSTLERTIFGIKPQREAIYQIQQNFNGDFKIGQMRNRIVIGADIYLYGINSTFRNGPTDYWYRDTLVTNDPAADVNISKEKVLAFIGAGKTDNYLSRSNTYSAYA